MKVTFKNGQVEIFANAAVQEKDGGQVIALYDIKTCRIFAEFSRDLVDSWGAEPLTADPSPPLHTSAAGA